MFTFHGQSDAHRLTHMPTHTLPFFAGCRSQAEIRRLCLALVLIKFVIGGNVRHHFYRKKHTLEIFSEVAVNRTCKKDSGLSLGHGKTPPLHNPPQVPRYPPPPQTCLSTPPPHTHTQTLKITSKKFFARFARGLAGAYISTFQLSAHFTENELRCTMQNTPIFATPKKCTIVRYTDAISVVMLYRGAWWWSYRFNL